MTRFPDWQSQFAAYLADTRGQTFRWGRMDCALFVAGAVQAMTGEDIARGWRGYRTEAEAHRLMASKGFPQGADHADVIASLLREIGLHEVRAGDVVLASDRALGICQGRMIYTMTPSGLALAPMATAVRAFRV